MKKGKLTLNKLNQQKKIFLTKKTESVFNKDFKGFDFILLETRDIGLKLNNTNDVKQPKATLIISSKSF